MSLKTLTIKHKVVIGLFVAAIFAVTAFVVHPALAQDTATFAREAGLGTQADLRLTIARMIRIVIGFLGVIAVLIVLAGGFLWMTAAGDVKKVDRARRLLINGLIGLVITLASFGIATFVISRLAGVVGVGDITTTDGCDPAVETCYNDPLDPKGQFVLRGVNNQCGNLVRNTKLQFVFSKNVVASTVSAGGIRVTKLDDSGNRTDVDGDFSVNGSRVTFTPSASCGEAIAPGQTCFEANKNHRIELSAAILKASPGNKSLVCDSTYRCSYEFTTGVAVDVEDPTLVMNAPAAGASIVRGGAPELLQTLATDDAGVSVVDFYVDGEQKYTATGTDRFETTAAESGKVSAYFRTDTNVEWSTLGYRTNERYEISATGVDCAGREASAAPVQIILRPENCSNNEIDMGETALNCGGSESSQYFCGRCTPDVCDPAVETCDCNENWQCASGFCNEETNVCESKPTIDRVSPGDGAVGNLISILGKGFGSAPGTVMIGTTQAAAYVCEGTPAWQDNQIIVQVRDGMTDGPVEVLTAPSLDADNNPVDPKSDSTDDDWGPYIPDFDVNDIVRPGICRLNPSLEQSGNVIDVAGNNYQEEPGTSAVYFGVNAASVTDWNDTQIETRVPLMDTGTYNTQVFVGDNVCSQSGILCASDADCTREGEICKRARQGSNTVRFRSTSRSFSSSPEIEAVQSGWRACADSGLACFDAVDCNADPAGDVACLEASTWGPPGQYITLSGSNFGTGIGSVWFAHPDGRVAQGDISFPAVCEGFDTWHELSVIVKVPRLFTNDEPVETGITYTVTLERQDGARSNSIEFAVVEGDPTPGLCALEPSGGPRGSQVLALGENFGSNQGNIFMFDNLAARVNAWAQTEATFSVHDASQTGPVFVRSGGGGQSNALDFRVGDCRTDEITCREGESCCALSGACSADCGARNPRSQYAYVFSTSKIPQVPYVIESCGATMVSPTPSDRLSSLPVCLNAVVSASFSQDMDTTTLNGTNIQVRRCANATAEDCRTWVNFSFTSAGTRAFRWRPMDGAFAAGTTYRVTLKGGPSGIRSAEGVPLAQDYTWTFTTAAAGASCSIGSVFVSPDDYTATVQGQHIDYLPMPVAAEDACVLLDCGDYQWTWGTSDSTRASFPSTLGSASTCINTATALLETPNVKITAEAGNTGVKESRVGARINMGGSITFDDGTQVFPTTPEHPAGAVLLPDGGMRESGQVPIKYADGTVLDSAKGEVVWKGHTVLPDLSVRLADGTVIPPGESTGLPSGITRISANRVRIDRTGDGKFPITIYERSTMTNATYLLVTAPTGARVFTLYNSGWMNVSQSGLVVAMAADGYLASMREPGTTTTIRLLEDGKVLRRGGWFGNAYTYAGYDWNVPSALNVTGEADLAISFTDPEVTAWYPSCSHACVNAAIGAEFNVPMRKSTIHTGSVHLEKCGSTDGISICDGATQIPFSGNAIIMETLPPDAFTTEPLTQAFVIDLGRNALAGGKTKLDPNAVYRVRVDATLASRGGETLAKKFPSGFSWLFRTKSDAAACGVDRIEISPFEAKKQVVGDRQEFYAHPFGAPDECSLAGQMLNPSEVTWSPWTARDQNNKVGAVDSTNANEIIASVLYSRAIPDLASLSSAVCSVDSCLNLGTSFTTRDPLCGDGRVDAAYEECDDGNVADGDGCSAQCKRSIRFACSDTTTTNCCGNGTVENTNFEDCDDDNASESDACSNRCQWTGIRAGLDVCGNDSLDIGEECDDGNETNGDGCSTACLFEGSTPKDLVFAVCGDGVVGPGEDCDGGNFANGDGCSARCLREGSSAAYGSDCGNRLIETGEDCDDGNEQSGDGCSSRCLREGSSAFHKAPGVPSFCGDGIGADAPGTGEECEASTASTGNGPYGLTQVEIGAVREVDQGTKLATSTVSAWAVNPTGATVRGDAELSLSCACTTDLSCGAVNTLGCGTSGCCFNRPAIVFNGIYPPLNATNVCRNSAVWLAFNQQMDLKSFENAGVPNVYLELVKPDGGSPATSCPAGHQLLTSSDQPTNAFTDAWQWLKGRAHALFGSTALASPLAGKCVVPVTFAQASEGTFATPSGSAWVSRFRFDTPLLPGARYNIMVVGDNNRADDVDSGIVSVEGVSAAYLAAGSKVGTFTTQASTPSGGDGICKIDTVEVRDLGKTAAAAHEDASPGIFSKTGEQHSLIALAFSNAGGTPQEIQPTSAYRWAWDWGSVLPDAAGDIIKETPVMNPGDGLQTAAANATSQGRIGQEEVFASAIVGESERMGKVNLTATLCENTWPATAAFNDPTYNYGFFYCRDGAGGSLLPGLQAKDVEVTERRRALNILQEKLFVVEGSRDALGVRVMQNPSSALLPPEAWYKEMEFTGSPTPATVDGYPALKDGATTYVFAANRASMGDGQTHENIYVFSYNTDASESSRRIFEQILGNLKFNTNTAVVSDVNLCVQGTGYERDAAGNFVSCRYDGQCASGSCDAKKGKLQRDLQRLFDLTRMHDRLDNRAAYPQLAEGTFIRGLSTSVWPSWNAALSNALGTALPTDPINELTGCGSLTTADPDTCFEATKGEFSCDDKSLIYGFRGTADAYRLFAHLENDPAIWSVDLPDFDRLCEEGAKFGISTTCGDGILGLNTDGTTEACEIGQTRAESCDSGNGSKKVKCIEDLTTGRCRFETAGDSTQACVPKACGNGVVDGTGELCDEGSLNGTYGHCSAACDWNNRAYCGDGYLAASEICDCGTVTNFTAVSADPGSWANLKDCAAANGQYNTAGPAATSCRFDCSAAGASCGNGEVDAGEQCDGGQQAWAGKICSDNLTTCSTNADCPSGTTCGGSINRNACPQTTVCLDGTRRGLACTSSSDTDTTNGCPPNTTTGEVGTCSNSPVQTARLRSCNTTPGTAASCTWNIWNPTCTSGAFCGNGRPETGEECDDGNRENGDACTNACLDNLCGDGFVDLASEQCDAGAQRDTDGDGTRDAGNGIACTPSHDGTCSFCDNSCRFQTRSGSYCGDGVRNGDELCDGADVPKYCYKSSTSPSGREIGGTCAVNGDCASGFSCQAIGMCNGGANNGASCRISSAVADCGAGNACTPTVCSDDCTLSCPFTLQVASVPVRPVVAGADPGASVDLYSYHTEQSPNSATLLLPACTVATQITADVTKPGFVIPRSIDIVFVTDLSGSMDSQPSDEGFCKTGPDELIGAPPAVCTLDEPLESFDDQCSAEVDCVTSTRFKFCTATSPKNANKFCTNTTDCSMYGTCTQQVKRCGAVSTGATCSNDWSCNTANTCVPQQKRCNAVASGDPCGDASDCFENTCVTWSAKRGRCEGGLGDGRACNVSDLTACPGGRCQAVPRFDSYCSQDSSISCTTSVDCNPGVSCDYPGGVSGECSQGGVPISCKTNVDCNPYCEVHVLQRRCVGGSGAGGDCHTNADCPGGSCNLPMAGFADKRCSNSNASCDTASDCDAAMKDCGYPGGIANKCVGGNHAGDSCNPAASPDTCDDIGACVPENECQRGPNAPNATNCAGKTKAECDAAGQNFCTDNSQCYWGGTCENPDESRLDIVKAALMGNHTGSDADQFDGAIDKLFEAADRAGRDMRIGLVGYTHTGGAVQISEMPLTQSSQAGVLVSEINAYEPEGGTPTGPALARAIEMLESSSADKKVIVLLSDGNPTWTMESDQNAGPVDPDDAAAWDFGDAGTLAKCSNYKYRSTAWGGTEYYGTEACVAQINFEHILPNRQEIDFFSAVIAQDPLLIGYMAHASSNACERDWDDVADCPIRNNVQYAYQADTKDEILTMYNEMITVILQMSFASLVDTGEGWFSRGIGLGSDVVLPFPDQFKCNGLPINMPFTSTFYVDGTVNFTDFKFKYCPLPPTYTPAP